LLFTYAYRNGIAIETKESKGKWKSTTQDTQNRSEQLRYTVWTVNHLDKIPVGYSINWIWTDIVNIDFVTHALLSPQCRKDLHWIQFAFPVCLIIVIEIKWTYLFIV